MARTVRLEYPGACYHVINRGNYRRNLFADEGAARAFEGVLAEACERFGWRLHAYIIMRNHFHLALETPEPNLSLGMKWLQGTWVMRANRFRGQTGRPFQGRFKALHVEPGHALAQVAHYIHLNPVRAKIALSDRLADFRWSSLHHFRRKDRPGWLEPATILAESGGLADTKAGWNAYLGYLAFLAEEATSPRKERFAKLSRGWCIGSDKFRAALKKDLVDKSGKLSRFAGLEREEWQKECGLIWEKKLTEAARVLKIDLKALPSRKSAREKVVLAALLKRTTSVSNLWLAQRLEMGAPASVSQFIRRFRLARGDETRPFQAALVRVKI